MHFHIYKQISAIVANKIDQYSKFIYDPVKHIYNENSVKMVKI